MTIETPKTSTLRLALGATALTLIGSVASADQVIVDDLIVQGSICAGQDCVNGESFGFDTLRLKENNLRIKAQDTSNSASFPTVDWQITFNDTTNGGANKFSIDNIDSGRTPFTIRDGAPTNSLFVDSSGRLGIKNGTPVTDIHVKSGNTPTLRLEQDGSSGFTAQTWDMAGNEANFFIRDATNGSTLPLRIEPGAASNMLYFDSTDNIGINTTSPGSELDVRGQLNVLDNQATVLKLANSGGGTTLQLNANNDATFWNMTASADNSQINFNVNDGAGDVEMILTDAGDLTIAGQLVTTGPQCASGTPCDAVFDPAVYKVPSIEEHAAVMWENKYLPAVGPTGSDMPMNLTERFGKMLNELEHAHIYIDQLNAELKTQSAEHQAVVAALSARLERLETARAE